MSHKLAVTGKITSIETIEGADRIVSANVSCGEEGQWTGVVGKDKFKPEDLVTVYLQDAVLKPAPEYNFLKSSNYRIKICRLRGSPSECLIMPHIRGVEGDDLTEELGVTKYEKPIPAELGGVCIGGRPYGIPKTDEDNFQRARKVMRAMHGKPYYISIKSDGSSGTWYWNNGKFGCCSRELDLTESDTNTFWVLARKYGVREYMDKVGKNVAIQFEAVGPKIQGNPMGLTGFEARAFNYYDIDEHAYKSFDVLKDWAATPSVPLVDVIEEGESLPELTNEEWRKKSEVLYPNGKPGEGIVIRLKEEQRVGNLRCSFKVINPLYETKSKR